MEDSCGNVRAVRNAKDTTELYGYYYMSQCEVITVNFVYRYKEDGCAFISCNALSVNATMSVQRQTATLPSIVG